jgi:hypothetical protein
MMAMYVQLLSAVFTADRSEMGSPGDLLTTARRRRGQMLSSTLHAPATVERYLAHDVSYDCALIRLCGAVGIPATPADFSQPLDERARLERALAEAGIDLGAGLSSRPPPD